MSQAAYPGPTDLACFLDAAGLALTTTVMTGAASGTQRLASVQGIRVGDSLWFRSANQTLLVTAVSAAPTNTVTLAASVTTITGEVVLDLPRCLSLDLGIAAGIARFEREAGRVMLAPVSPYARTFDPPVNGAGMLDLKGDLVAVSSVSYAGTPEVAPTDYRLLPQDAPGDGLPWNRLQFVLRWFSPLSAAQWGGISITGRWGYGTTIPDDAWQAMLEGAAMDRLPLIIAAFFGGMVEWREADAQESYGPKPFQYLKDAWDMLFTGAVKRYKRVTVGI